MNQRNGNGQKYDMPPHDEVAEMCLLACHQWDDSLFDKITLQCDEFYKSSHQTIFRVMLDLHNDGIPPDTVTVTSSLSDRNLLSDVGGLSYIEECLSITPHTENVEYYANIVKEKAWLRRAHQQSSSFARACLSGGVTRAELNDGVLDLRDLLDDCDATDLKTVPIGELIKNHPKLKPPVIDGLIRRGETCNIIANPKVGKSWLSYDLALSIATGRDWLTFQTSPGRVLLIDNELHPESIAKRIPTVADALSIRPEDYQNRIDVISLRGRLTDFYGIAPIIRRIEQGKYVAVIIDAYYRMLPQGISENDNAQIAQIYNTVDFYSASTDAAWFLIHHSTKGSQSDKRATDVGAGAGSQSRAADCHLVLREHEEAGFVVLDAAVRSFPPVEPVVLEWIFPIWTPVEHLDPGKLKRKLTGSDERQIDRDAEGFTKIADVLLKGPKTIRALRGKTGISRDRLNRLLDKLEADDQVAWTEIKVKGNTTREYSLCD